MTRLGDLLYFGQLFKDCVATIILPKLPAFLGNFCKGVEIFHFSSEIVFLGNFCRHLATFTGHTGLETLFDLKAQGNIITILASFDLNFLRETWQEFELTTMQSANVQYFGMRLC